MAPAGRITAPYRLVCAWPVSDSRERRTAVLSPIRRATNSKLERKIGAAVGSYARSECAEAMLVLIPIFVALTLLAIWFAEITTALLLLVVAMSIAGAVTLFILGSGYSVLW